MKLFLAASLVLVSISCFGFDRDKVVTFSNLPKESQKFIKTHFPNVKVSTSSQRYRQFYPQLGSRFRQRMGD